MNSENSIILAYFIATPANLLTFIKPVPPHHHIHTCTLMVMALGRGIKNEGSMEYMIHGVENKTRQGGDQNWRASMHVYITRGPKRLDWHLESCGCKWCDLRKFHFPFWDTDSSGVVEDNDHFHLGRLWTRLNMHWSNIYMTNDGYKDILNVLQCPMYSNVFLSSISSINVETSLIPLWLFLVSKKIFPGIKVKDTDVENQVVTLTLCYIYSIHE